MITLTLTDQAASLLTVALEAQAKAIAGAKLYTAKEAMKDFNLPRSAFAYITPTILPGKANHLFAAEDIISFIQYHKR